jgi:hypothetical protein
VKWVVVGYAVIVIAVAGVMGYCRGCPAPSAGASNTSHVKGREDMQWSQVVTVKVPAKPSGIWTWAVDPLQGPARIQIEAAPDAGWSYSPGKTCGADGDLAALLSTEHALYAKAPIGALLVKIGGSTAGANDGTIRVAGAKTYFEIGEKITAPIFLTINDELASMGDNSGEIQVTISIHPLPKPSSQTEGGDADATSGADGGTTPATTP